MLGCHNKINPEYTANVTARPSHFTDTCQRYPSSKWLAKWTLWIRNVNNKFISRCHQRPCIIQVYQNNTWDHFIKMYEWKYPNKIILTEYISRHYTDHNMVFQSFECMSDIWHRKNNEKFWILYIIHIFTSQNLQLSPKYEWSEV
jgi:hypothetical protein